MTPPAPRRWSFARRAVAAVVPLAVLSALVPAAGAAASGPDSGPVSRGVAIPAFYDPPAHLPKGKGRLVRTEPLPLALGLPGITGAMPGAATRLMYTTTDANGRPVAATGAYLEPSASWKGTGSRPLVALAPGTMGQGDQCAASLGLQHLVIANSKTVSVSYENLAIYRLLSQGIAVVITDYIGLGTTDRVHAYTNRLDEAHALLDAVRAARRLHGTSLTHASAVGLYGYSQGGGASAAAAELQPRYAPELHLAGTYAGAPPANLTRVIRGIDGSALAGALGWAVNGLVQDYPSIKPIVDSHTNAAGRAALADLSTMCVGDAIFGYAFSNSTKWTTDGKSISQIIAADPAIAELLAKQRIGTLKPISPVRIATGVKDDIVIHAQSRQLAVDWCAKGANVTYVPIDLADLGDKLLTNHLAPLLTDQSDAIAWLTDRINGRPASSTCTTLPDQP